MKSGCNEDILHIENDRVLHTKHFWGVTYLLAFVGSFLGQYLEWSLLVNNDRVSFNCSPWIWYKTPLTHLFLRIFITLLLIAVIFLPAFMLGGNYVSICEFVLPLVVMFCLRFIFHKMKLDNPNAYTHDFLKRDSAMELS